jgi:hypothetical protein
MISATGQIFYMRNLKASRLDTFVELGARPGTKMISATRHISRTTVLSKMTISGRGNCDNPGKKPESFVDPGRPIAIALPIRVARRESLCRFASPDANRSVDSRRPT